MGVASYLYNSMRLTCTLKFDWNSSLPSAGTEESHEKRAHSLLVILYSE